MPDSDVQLMERLRDGDDDALGELVDRYQDELVGFFYHHCWDQLVAEELAQTVFIKIYRARERYQVSAKVRTYLYRIAHNAWIDHLRRRKHHVSLDQEVGGNGLRLREVIGDDGAGAPDLGPNKDMLRSRIQAAVETLPEGQRSVFMMANNQGMKYAEISSILEIPEGTVKSRMHAAVRNLRGQLEDLLEELA